MSIKIDLFINVKIKLMRAIHTFLMGSRCPNVGACIVRALGINTALISKLRHGAAACAGDIVNELKQHQQRGHQASRGHQAGRALWLPNYAAMNYRRGLLDRYGAHNTPGVIEQRRALAFEILELEKKCLHAWALADYEKATGQPWAPPQQDRPEDPRALAELLLKKRRQLARLETKQRKEPTEARAQRMAQLRQELGTA
jgi:hypothetical protein